MTEQPERRPFRAVDVLSGGIDRKPVLAPVKERERTRKQISAQLAPAQVRTLGELHARLNAGARTRIEKSDLVGLGIELLASAVEAAGRDLAPAPDNGAETDAEFRDLEELRAYVATYVRERSR